MNTSKLADIAEITSSVAILVTLVFLVIQLQQNTAAIQAAGQQTALSEELQFLYRLADDPTISMSWFNPDMSDAEKIQTHFNLVAFIRQREFAWFQYQSGSLDAATWETIRGPIATVLTSELSRGWWRNAGPVIFDTAFVANVDELLAQVPPNEGHVLGFFE